MDKNAVFKNLLFDLDGTLTDPALGITSAAQYALCKMGIEVADRTTLTWLIGPPLIGSFEEGFGMTNLQALETLWCFFRWSLFKSRGGEKKDKKEKKTPEA